VPSASLILASASPQRRAILKQIGVAFEVHAPAVDELSEGPPAEVALENAYRKAAAIAPAALPVLGVDTVVSLGREIFGKPRDAQHAAEMLGALAGQRHAVISGVCLIDGDRVRTAAAHTTVEFRPLDAQAVAAYVGIGEWEGRAGAYAIQGRGAVLVSRIEGDYLNVVGLPVSTLVDMAPELIADGAGW
jgi:septum formation protein